jgi:hypothetical protein
LLLQCLPFFPPLLSSACYLRFRREVGQLKAGATAFFNDKYFICSQPLVSGVIMYLSILPKLHLLKKIPAKVIENAITYEYKQTRCTA